MDSHDKAMTVVERGSEHRALSPAVSAIMEKNLDPSTVRELVAIQREYEANEARKAYSAALVGLKADLPTILAHDKLVAFNTTRYTHTTLGAAVEAVTPHLINHGFVCNWYPATDRDVAVTCRLTHREGHFEEVTLRAPPDTKGSKNGAQAVMSTVTMLERYTLLALLGIATADMDEIDKAETQPDPGKIDSQRNLRAVGLLKKHGKTREQAEQFLGGKKVADWTEADLKRLEAWAKPAIKHATDCGVNAPGGGGKCDCQQGG